MGSNEDCGNGKEVGSEVMFVLFMVALNHEFSASLLEDELKEVASNSCKPVSVGNHNLRDHPIEHLFQNGFQTFSLEVDSGGDIADDDVGRVRFFEIFNLASEIASLLGGTNAGVDVCVFACNSGGEVSEQT